MCCANFDHIRWSHLLDVQRLRLPACGVIRASLSRFMFVIRLHTQRVKVCEKKERHQRDRVIPSPSHSDILCLCVNGPCAGQHSQQLSHSTRPHLFEENAAVIQLICKGRSPNLRHVTRTHRVDLDQSFERANVNNSIFDKILLTKRTFTTKQWQSLSHLWHIRQPYDSSDARIFSY